MTHPVDRLQDEARAAIEAMKAAAITARRLHAHAELMRHMRTTAEKLSALPLEEAARKVSGEWMQAWSLSADAYPALAEDIRRFALAFCTDARGSDAATQAAIVVAIDGLETGFAGIGTSVSDQMAFRSECAHGWWHQVVPPPSDMPAAGKGVFVPFWATGAPPHCGATEA